MTTEYRLPSEIIIELNEKIIHQNMYEKQTISPNDSIEIIRYIGGGKD